MYYCHLPSTLLPPKHGDLYIEFNIVLSPGMGMRGGQDVFSISSCGREFAMALKKQPRTKLFGLFGDTPPNEQGQFKDKHSLNFI